MPIPNKKTEDVWKFTKQETRFDQVIRATRVFQSALTDGGNIENYFEFHHEEFDLETNRHRILTSAQLYGLVTKEEFYTKRSVYQKESVTNAFTNLNAIEENTPEYNTLLTEQLLKIKIKAIVDTTDGCLGWQIYPVIASYLVLKKLRDAGKKSVDMDRFISYAMRCASFDEIDSAVENILKDAPPVENVTRLADLSRIKKVLDNLNLFVINEKEKTIGLNSAFVDYFEENFIQNEDFKQRFMDALKSDSRYKNFLYTTQYFEINLIDKPDGSPDEEDVSSEDQKKIMKKIRTKHPESPTPSNVNRLLELINKDYDNEPVRERKRVCTTLARNKTYADAVKLRAQYTCEICGTLGFMKPDGSRYAEAHHVGELAKTKIDNPNVMICVCPTCHRIIHYGTQEELDKRTAMGKRHN